MHYVYIPGLGDSYDPLRRLALWRWWRASSQVSFVPMRWNNQVETWQQKYQRVLDAIEQARHKEVTIVGESAGGAMAVYTLANDTSHSLRAITLCGYNHGAGGVSVRHKKAHPAFYELMPEVDIALKKLNNHQRARITTYYSTKDPVVSSNNSCIHGAANIAIHTNGHFRSIVKLLLSRNLFQA